MDDKKTLHRKAVYTRASIEAFDHFEMLDSEGMTSGEFEGDWTATKLATEIIGLAIIDAIGDYENAIEAGLDDDVREVVMLSSIHEAALETAVKIFAKAFRLVGLSGDELVDALDDLRKEEMFGDDSPEWCDVPDEIINIISEKTGKPVEELRDKYSFKAVDASNGRMLDKETIAEMTADNTLVDVQFVNHDDIASERDSYHIDDQESALDDFLKGFES